MKYLFICLPILASLSCGGSGTSPTQTNQSQSLKTPIAQNTQAAPRETKSSPDLPPNIPKDAQWTILAAVITGPDHAAQARAARTNLINSTKMRDWYIVSGEGQTTLYYGYYRSINDPKDAKESARAQGDRRIVAALTDPASGGRLFNSVFLTKLDAPDPASPPQWDLASAKGAYSVQVAVFKDNPERKTAAVEAVRAARAQGYEAYYFHGPTASSVCIGAWPDTAVSEQNDFNVKQQKNPTAVPLVTAGAIPTFQNQGELMTPDGKPINVVAAKFEVLDPRLMAIMQQFPYHSINGVEQPVVLDPRTGQKRLAPKRPSFLVRIPHHIPQPAAPAIAGPLRDDPIRAATDPAPNAQENQPAPPPPVTPSNASKGGKLKSIE